METVDCTQEDHQTNASVSLALPSLLPFLLIAGVKADLLDFQLFCTDHGGIDSCVPGTMELQQMDLLDMGNNTETGVGAQCFGKRETFLLSNFCEDQTMALSTRVQRQKTPKAGPAWTQLLPALPFGISSREHTDSGKLNKSKLRTGVSFCCCG